MAAGMDLLHHRSSSLFRHSPTTTPCTRGRPLDWLPIVVCCVARVAVLDAVEARKALQADKNGDVGLVFRSIQHYSSSVAPLARPEQLCGLASLGFFLRSCVSHSSFIGFVGDCDDFSDDTGQKSDN